jgi:hypothetical protein
MAKIPGVIYPTSARGDFLPNAATSPLLAEIEAQSRVSEMVEQYKEDARTAALRSTAPPLTFADCLFKDEQK